MEYGERFTFDDWSKGDSWDHDTGAPEIHEFANAVQHWAIFQNREKVTVAEAAAAFNCDPARIVEAVDVHHWMYRTGPDDDFTKMFIEHEGE